MKKALALFTIVIAMGMTAFDAEAAKRLGGGKSSGMQRQNISTPAKPGAPANTTASPAQTAPAAGATAAAAAPAAAAAKRSWMGPIAGLAAGLGLAALASHFGFGEGLANMLMIGLLAVAVMAAVGFFLRKRAAGQRPALAGAGAGAGAGADAGGMAYRNAEPAEQRPGGGSLIGSRIGSGVASLPVAGSQVGNLPADFDAAAFERNAIAQFMALQTANDGRDMTSLRDYLTPEMFDAVSAEIAERGDAPQKTEVFGLHAQALDVEQDEQRYVVSVRFTGSVRDQLGAVPEDLDEIWHLTKPRAGLGGWVIAGIQQTPASA